MKNLVKRPAILRRDGGKKRGKELRGVKNLSKEREGKKGKEIRDPRKDLKVFRGELSIGLSEMRLITSGVDPDIFGANEPF